MSRRSALPVSLTTALAAFCLAASTAVSGPQGEPLDERRFLAASDLERAGQLGQARDIYRQIVSATPGSERADDALLALGRIAWPVSSTAELARLAREDRSESSAEAALAARSSLLTLRANYPDGDVADDGLWRLALTYLLPTPLTWRPEEAAALLTTLPVLHPASPRVPAALGLAAKLHADSGRSAQARELAFELLAEWPEAGERPGAWITLGRLDYASDRVESALRAFGRSAQESRMAERQAGAQEELAVSLATVVDRFIHGPTRDGPLYARQPGGIEPSGRVSSLAIDAVGRLIVSSEREEEILLYGPDGRLEERRAVPGLTVAVADGWGGVWVARESSVIAAGGASITIAERAEPVSLAPVSPGSAWVVNSRESVAVRVEAGAGMVAVARVPDRARTLRVAPTVRGEGAWILTDRPPSLIRVDAAGNPALTVDLTNLVREPIDLAVDLLGHVYVLDGKPAGVVTIRPDGARIARFDLPAGERAIERPEAIAVGNSGEIAVYDGRSGRISWFR